MGNKEILILSMGKYPNGDAGAVRQNTFANLFKLCGYKSFVIGMGPTTNFKTKIYDGIEYTSFRADKETIISRIFNLIFYKYRLKLFLNNHKKFSIIMVVGIPTNALAYIKRYAKKEKILLLHDCVEWYSPEQFKNGENAIAYKNNNNWNTKWIDKNFTVISISSFLEEHFKSRGINAVRIPAILDVENIKYIKNVNLKKLTILYAGAPGKKDYIEEMLRGVLLLDEENIEKLRFILAGVKVDDVKSFFQPEELKKLLNCVEFLGRVDRNTVLKKLEEADFTVLLRSPEQRYARAGFPTKVVESLATATPVILNLTSDLDKYINNFEEGLIVEDCTAESFAKTLKIALGLDIEKREYMRRRARMCAENNFDYRKYKDVINNIL